VYKLIVNNQDIFNDGNTVSWGGDTDNLGSQLTFDSIKEIPTGTVVQLFNDSLEIFRGIAFHPIKKRWIWSYTCQDYSYYLKNNKISVKQFYNMRADDAIRSLANEAYLICIIADMPTPISKTYSNTTMDKIIDDILEQAKNDQGATYFKEIEGNILYIRKLSEMKINPKIILPKQIDIDMSMEKMKNRITVTSGNDDNAKVEATAEDTSQQGFYGVLSDNFNVEDKNIAQAQNIANNALANSNKIEYSATLNDMIALKDGDLIKPNRMIYLQAGSRLNGYYKIKNANHKLQNGLHKASITVVW
jgi:hypothetical protein